MQLNKMIRLVSLATFAILCMFLYSCDPNRIMEENKPLKGEEWSYENPQVFEADITDTTVHYNIYVNIRHSFHFEWRNVWVNIATEFPDGKKLSKRVNLLLSEADGVWFGDCSGDNCDLSIPIQENAIFPQTGKYKFTISQDMRENPLKNIRNVGLRVEKYTEVKPTAVQQ